MSRQVGTTSSVEKGPMLVGIETGGTKLQLAVAPVSAPNRIQHQLRFRIRRKAGAEGIRNQIQVGMAELTSQFNIQAIGFGFGGPVHADTGDVITSHQVAGWDAFPLVQWCHDEWGLATIVGNDCSVAALAEAQLGAGRGYRRMLYVTVGTGVGGGLVIDGRVDGEDRPAAAEVGHLRLGPDATGSDQTVESKASGLGIEQAAVNALRDPAAWGVDQQTASDLHGWKRNGQLTTKEIAAAARAEQPLAQRILDEATRTLGWGLAQATTLMAPQRIVVGGGVPLMGGEYLDAVRAAWQTYCFAPLQSDCDIVGSELGEQVVLLGALLLASGIDSQPSTNRTA